MLPRLSTEALSLKGRKRTGEVKTFLEIAKLKIKKPDGTVEALQEGERNVGEKNDGKHLAFEEIKYVLAKGEGKLYKRLAKLNKGHWKIPADKFNADGAKLVYQKAKDLIKGGAAGKTSDIVAKYKARLSKDFDEKLAQLNRAAAEGEPFMQAYLPFEKLAWKLAIHDPEKVVRSLVSILTNRHFASWIDRPLELRGHLKLHETQNQKWKLCTKGATNQVCFRLQEEGFYIPPHLCKRTTPFRGTRSFYCDPTKLEPERPFPGTIRVRN
jgi:hypothetical protein